MTLGIAFALAVAYWSGFAVADMLDGYYVFGDALACVAALVTLGIVLAVVARGLGLIP